MAQDLWQIRRRKQMTIEELAQRAGIHPTLIKAYELGQRPIAERDMEKLARALLVETWDIKEMSDPPPRGPSRYSSPLRYEEPGESYYSPEAGRPSGLGSEPASGSSRYTSDTGGAGRFNSDSAGSGRYNSDTSGTSRYGSESGGSGRYGQEPGSGSRYGSEGGSRYGSEGGSRYGSEGGSRYGSSGGSRYGSEGGSRYGSEGGSRYGSEGGSRYGSDSMGRSRYGSESSRSMDMPPRRPMNRPGSYGPPPRDRRDRPPRAPGKPKGRPRPQAGPARPSQIEHLKTLLVRLDISGDELLRMAGKPLSMLNRKEAARLLAHCQEMLAERKPERPKGKRQRPYLPESVDEHELVYLTEVQMSRRNMQVMLFNGENMDGRLLGFSPYALTLVRPDDSEVTVQKLAIAYYRVDGLQMADIQPEDAQA